MGTTFDQSTHNYLEALDRGADLETAICEANLVQHRDQVFAAALDMLSEEGVIDMKRLAARAGISRASLYRYYPDKLSVEAEVAAAMASRMAEAAAPHELIVDKLRASVEALIDFPAGAASLAPVVAAADVKVISKSCEVIIGHIAATPVVVGFAAMVTSAHRSGQLDEVRAMLDTVIHQFQLSIA